jgi:hypothetical protein
MNSHAQLLWQSIVAPRAAADLAVSHPNTNRLGWTYVMLLAVLTLAAEPVVRYLFAENLHNNSTITGAGAVAIATYYAASYVFLRWFWRVMVGERVSSSVINGAIAVSYACSAAILFPKSILSELTQQNVVPVPLLGFFVPIIAVLVLSSIAFQNAYAISFSKALVLNLSANVLLLIAASLSLFTLLYIWPESFGTSWGPATKIETTLMIEERL